METTETDCLFCKIIKREIPAQIVYEDTETIAFLDIAPNNHGHTLVIPKDHAENIFSMPAEGWARLMLAVQRIAPAVKVAAQADGLNLIMNNESAAGQVVPHVHIHLVPRHHNDEWPRFPHKPYLQGEMEAMAAKIKEEIEREN